MYYIFRLASLVVPRFPAWLVLALSKLIGFLAWLVAKKARKQATANMLHVLGLQVRATRAGRRRLRRTVRGMFQNNVRNYLEVFSLPYIQPDKLLSRIHVEGLEHLDAALSSGKGLILCSAHFGPFDYMAQGIPMKGYSVTIPVEQVKDPRILDLILRLRRSKGVQYLPLGGSSPMRSIIQALRKNQIVLITADRAIQGESVEKPFFGAPAQLPTGPVTLAQRTGAALVGGFGWRTSSTHIEVQFVPISAKLTEEERANTDIMMNRLIESMENAIRAHPEQWVVFAPVWVTNP